MQTSVPTDPAPPAGIPVDSGAGILAANLAAFDAAGQRHLRPLCGDATARPPWEFVLGRDGFPTYRSADGAWAAGCSLPLRAARQQLKSMDVGGAVGCFLDPPHPAHLRVALDRLGPHQALVAIVPDAGALPLLLGCVDLSADAAAGRLWLVAGGGWAAQLRDVYDRHPGLMTPTQFVRLVLPDVARLDPVIEAARAVFEAVTNDRSQRADDLAAGWRPAAGTSTSGPPRLCVVTGRTFRLWDDAGPALADAVAAAAVVARAASAHSDAGGPADLRPLDADDPTSASTLALLAAATEAGALLTADVGRADLPGLLPPALPWATWATTPRLPAAAAAGPNDRLLVADPAWRPAAVAAGWPTDQIDVAGWPTLSAALHGTPVDPPSTAPPHLAVFADVGPLDPPDRLEEFSSHRLFWNAIRDELAADPYAAGTDAAAYLADRCRRFDLGGVKIDDRLFLRDLIAPAVARGVVAKLAAAGVPLRLHGRGWADVPDFAPMAAGPVESRAELAASAGAAVALLDPRPAGWRTGLWALGRPVVRCGGQSHAAVLSDVRLALAGRVPAINGPAVPELDVVAVANRLAGRS